MALTSNAQASSSRQGQRGRPAAASPEEVSDEERLEKPKVNTEEMDVDDDELEAWTVNTYVPQTVQRGAHSESGLTKLLTELQGMQTSISDSIDKVIETAEKVEDASEGDAMIEELAEGVCRSIEIKAVLGIKCAVIKAIQVKIRRGEEISDPSASYEKQAQDQTEAYMRKSKRQKFGQDEDYQRFRTDVWAVSHSNQACPPMSHFLDKGEGDEESDDDDVEVGPTMQNYKCAASHFPIEEAMVSACGHHYSRKFVMQLFEQQTGRGKDKVIKCPAVGCNAMVQQSQLKSDKAFQAKADQHFKRETQRQDEDVEDFEDLSQDD